MQKAVYVYEEQEMNGKKKPDSRFSILDCL